MSAAPVCSPRATPSQADFPQLEFHGLHARYEDGIRRHRQRPADSCSSFSAAPSAISTTPTFRAFSAPCRRPWDRTIISCSAPTGSKPVKILEDAYNDSRGVTAEFILNVFRNINRLLESNFDLDKMRYHSWFNPEWQQIEMYAVANARHEIRFPSVGSAFQWQQRRKNSRGDQPQIRPQRLQEQLRFFGLPPVRAPHRSERMVFRSALLKKSNPDGRFRRETFERLERFEPNLPAG